MKLLVTLCLMATLASVAYARSSGWGRRSYNDTLIHNELVVRRPQRGVPHNVQVNYPSWGQINNKTITSISVIDNYRNNSGANAALLSGGPNYKFAKILLKSLPSVGINSSVLIFGRRL